MTDQPKRPRGRPRKVRPEGEIAADEMVARTQRTVNALATGDWLGNAKVSFGTTARPIPAVTWADDPWSATRSEPQPTTRLRIRAGEIQQAWQHPTGTQWRPLPVVPDNAPDWEDG